MPAKNLSGKNEKGIYFYIHNKGIDNRTVFNDTEDYGVFQSFLKDYLTAPQDPESTKKVFTVHGRIFRGTPHQPKNYFNKVQLIAYSLMPNRFNLILRQKTRGSIESFIRSLCTRYSIYFNKKHRRTGSLFDGPYKSVCIDDKLQLLHLTRHLHRTGEYTSYDEYLGARATTWVKPDAVLTFLDKEKGSYKDFVEQHSSAPEEKELLKGIIFDDKVEPLERRDFARNIENYPPKSAAEFSEKTNLSRNLKPLQRIPEFLATAIVFLFLLAFGIKNITVATTKVPIPPSPSPAVLSETTKTEETETQEEANPKIMLTIKVNYASASVNIRQEPTISSKKIGEAKNGDTFEFVSLDSGWYEVKLATGSAGFISEKFIKEGEVNK